MGNPLSSGGMSPNGTTTPVKINTPGLDYSDKKVICSAICYCNNTPGVGKDGRSLKQSCVSDRLSQLDKYMMHRSPYKPEVNYDMTKEPPAPIMDSSIETKGHDWLPGWIKKWWGADEEHPPFKAGTGMIRRPDVVIVQDPSKPPTQDNLKKVVEIKFPPDTVSSRQRDDYIDIAGDEKKFVSLKPSDCDCDQQEPEESKVPSEELGAAAAAAAWAAWLLTRGKTPRPPVPAF